MSHFNCYGSELILPTAKRRILWEIKIGAMNVLATPDTFVKEVDIGDSFDFKIDEISKDDINGITKIFRRFLVKGLNECKETK